MFVSFYTCTNQRLIHLQNESINFNPIEIKVAILGNHNFYIHGTSKQ